MENGVESAEFGIEGEGGDTTKDEADHEDGEPDANAAEMMRACHSNWKQVSLPDAPCSDVPDSIRGSLLRFC
jgi:hypothetical protein